jgi:aspartyl-tRNA(Asn)/glutamyl-tRNA(Gln) amidotransferase subunit A
MSLLKHAKQYLANQAKYAHLNAFISRVDIAAVAQTPSPPRKEGEPRREPTLEQRPIAIKDNICTKELKTTAASGVLKDFTSPYDATVVRLLQDAGAVVVGKTNMDEFGMGSHSMHSHAGPVAMRRYEGEEASAGGSSGGSALAVASAQCWAALGTDTGGSVRLPAAYTGVVGFKPSYGLLSRRGVIAYANSLDTVGILSKSAGTAKVLFDTLNVHDPQDPTSLSPSTRSRLVSDAEPPASLRIGIPLDYNIASLHPTVRRAWIRGMTSLSKKGHTLHPVRLPATQHALSAYYVLAPAEASSNLARYDGVRFGSRAEGVDGTPESVLFAKTRGQGFGPEVQRRILLGAFTLSADAIDNYFIQAQKVRRQVQHDFDNVFAKANPLSRDCVVSETDQERVDVLLCPTTPTLAPSLSAVRDQDPVQAYMNDVFTVPASLAGLPAISVPLHTKKEESIAAHGDRDIRDSVGIQIIGQYGDDQLVLHAAKIFQAACGSVQSNAGPDMTAWGSTPFNMEKSQERKVVHAIAARENVSIPEAMAIAQTAEIRRYEQVTNMMLTTLGALQLDETAALATLPRKKYIELFSKLTDPMAAEKDFFENMVSKKTKALLKMQKRSSPGTSTSLRLRRKVETLENLQERRALFAHEQSGRSFKLRRLSQGQR